MTRILKKHAKKFSTTCALCCLHRFHVSSEKYLMSLPIDPIIVLTHPTQPIVHKPCRIIAVCEITMSDETRALCCLGCFKRYFIADIMQHKYSLLFYNQLLIYREQTHTHLTIIKVQDK